MTGVCPYRIAQLLNKRIVTGFRSEVEPYRTKRINELRVEREILSKAAAREGFYNPFAGWRLISGYTICLGSLAGEDH
jgi:hypothetical protein